MSGIVSIHFILFYTQNSSIRYETRNKLHQENKKAHKHVEAEQHASK